MMRQLTLASVLALAGCGAYPAQAEPPDITNQLERIVDATLRNEISVDRVWDALRSDQFEGIILALEELADKQDTIVANIATINRNQAMASQQSRAETVGTGASMAAVMAALAGGGFVMARKKKGG